MTNIIVVVLMIISVVLTVVMVVFLIAYFTKWKRDIEERIVKLEHKLKEERKTKL